MNPPGASERAEPLQRLQFTRTGSLMRVMPKAWWTWERTWAARARSSLAVALPRLVRARVCFEETAALPIA